MALREGYCQVRVVNNSDASSYWRAVAYLQADSIVGNEGDYPAGTALTFTIGAYVNTGGNALAPPPAAPTQVYFALFNGGTPLFEDTIFNNPTGDITTTRTYHLRADPKDVASALRCGTLKMRTRMQQNTGLATTQYQVNSDNANGTAASSGYSTSMGETGYVRANTTVVTTLDREVYAYPDSITATVALGCPSYHTDRGVTVALTGKTAVASGNTGATGSFTVALGGTDNTLPTLTATQRDTTTVIGASPLSGSIPWMQPTSLTEDSATTDPRLTATHLMQKNQTTFSTPPMSSDIGVQRLTNDIGFFVTRFTNARGEGVNGLTYNSSLSDLGALVDPVTRTGVVTSTQGGQAGWGASVAAWTAVLPGGTWRKTVTITAPSTATGLGTGTTKDYQLISADPNLICVCAGGVGTPVQDTRHFVPGEEFLAGLTVFHSSESVMKQVDAGTAKVALARFNLSLGQAEVLQADAVTWLPAHTGNVHYFSAVESFPGSMVHVVVIPGAATATWSASDVFTIGKASVGGVPVSNYLKEITVTGANNHTGYQFDGAGFIGFPTR